MELCDCCRIPAHRFEPVRRKAPVTTPDPVEQVDLSHTPTNAAPLAVTGQSTAYQALVGGFTNFSVASLPRIAEMSREHDPDQVTHVLYHKDCLDGMTAAWAAWKRLGDKAEYIAVDYQSPVPDLPREARVAVVDFSFPAEQMRELHDKVADVIVLDHHDSAKERLCGEEFHDYVLVDEQRAGAGLSWHYFHPEEPLPAKVAYAEDRDLWRFDLPLSAEVNKAMASHPFELQAWDKMNVDTLKRDGVEIYSFLSQQNEQLADLAQMGDIAGHRVPVVNTPVNVDELAAVVLKRFPDAPFMAAYHDDAEGNRGWEVRSRAGFVVNQVAALFGGGGHKEAAGFTEMRGEPIASGQLEKTTPHPELPRETQAVERFAGMQVTSALATARWGTVQGEKMAVANSALNVSDVGRGLQANFPESARVAVYHDQQDGRRHWTIFGPEGQSELLEPEARQVVARP